MTRYTDAASNIATAAEHWFMVWRTGHGRSMTSGLYVGADDEAAAESLLAAALADYTMVAEDRRLVSVTVTAVLGVDPRHESSIALRVVSAGRSYDVVIAAVAEVSGSDITLTLEERGSGRSRYRGRIRRDAGRSVITVPEPPPRPRGPAEPWYDPAGTPV
ncbi:MAG: hypothetical protein MUE98_08500 [Rhodobacteraceae bacterium]|jgi:hypothetical protein|nr:hypothetical protein [Paracoccaceae bacterium]